MSQGKQSPAEMLSNVFGVLKYGRTMLLLFAFGLSVGLAYYVYTDSVYMSKSLVRVNIVNMPLKPSQDFRSLVKLLDSRYMVERTAQRVGITSSIGDFHYIRGYFIKKVDIEVIDGQTLQIRVYAFDNDLAQRWPEALVQEYEEYVRDMRMRDRERKLELYTAELDNLKKKLDQRTEEAFNFEEENRITEIFIQQNELTQVPRDIIKTKSKLAQMNRIRAMLAEDSMTTIEKLSLLDDFQQDPDVKVGSRLPDQMAMTNGRNINQDGSPAINPPVNQMQQAPVVVMPAMVEGNQPWKDLEKRHRDLSEKIRQAEQLYLPRHHVMQALQEDMAEVERGLEVELDVALNRFNLTHENLQDRLDRLQEQMPQYREITRKYDRYSRDYAYKQRGFYQFDQAHQQLAEQITRLGYQDIENDMFVDLDFLGFTMKRNTPVSPARSKMLITSVAFGVILALAIPFGLNYMDDTTARLEQIEELLDIPGLGIVPLHDKAELDNIVRSPTVDANSPNRIMENFRVIRSAIALNKEMDLATQVILLTSARPQEGKTTIAANLAWSFASINEKTLLIDTDLRRGRIHKITHRDNSVGLSSVFEGLADLDEAIQETDVPNLHVLTRGPIIPGSTEKLCTDVFSNVLKELRRGYQRVILDSPPILGLSETSSLQRVVDGTVMVVKAEKTPRRELKGAFQLLRKSGGRFYGFVLNSLDLNKIGNYYNYYYYSSYYYSTFDDPEELEEQAQRLSKKKR